MLLAATWQSCCSYVAPSGVTLAEGAEQLLHLHDAITVMCVSGFAGWKGRIAAVVTAGCLNVGRPGSVRQAGTVRGCSEEEG